MMKERFTVIGKDISKESEENIRQSIL